MSRDEEDWEEKYRPRKFREVRGQDHAVRVLSGFVLRGTRGRNLLLQGAVGSGKTTLVRLFAMALNCEDIDEDGSPCFECARCLAPEKYLVEINAANFPDKKEDVFLRLQQLSRPSSECHVKVIFLDEAQGLNRVAQEGLLKVVEGHPEGVIFCFATTDGHKLSPALRSRLMDVRIEHLSYPVAIELLEGIARREALGYDREALDLLVAAKPPHGRDLVIGLQHLASFGQKIDVGLVKEAFDLSAYDHLSNYCLALATQDRNAQTAVMLGWRDNISVKIGWLERFLTTLYYNEVLGQRVVVDPLCYGMHEIRERFTLSMRARLRIHRHRDLRPIVEEMLEFWSQPRPPDQEVLYLKLALFEALVNQMEPAWVTADGSENLAQVQSLKPVTKQGANGSDWERVSAPASRFIERGEVRTIINRASYLTQHYGLYFNAAFKIVPAAGQSESDQYCAEAIEKCCKYLASLYEDATDGFAGILLLEREDDAVVGRLVARLPPSKQNRVAASPASAWVAWAEARGYLVEPHNPAQEESRGFHWRVVLDLCAGFDQDAGSAAEGRALRELLKVPKPWRSPGPVDATHLFISPALSSSVIDTACENEMQFISAFDAQAYSWVSFGWERGEYEDRTTELEKRRQRLKTTEDRYRNEPARCSSEINGLVEYWKWLGTERRPRKWVGWWEC